MLTIKQCQACGQCALAFPQYFKKSDDGTSYVHTQPPVEEEKEYTSFCPHIEEVAR